MSVLNENTIIGASAAGEYEIEQSLRFNTADIASLSRTPSVAGNRKTWTYSLWFKRGNLGNTRLFAAGTSGEANHDNMTYAYIASDKFQAIAEGSGTFDLRTTQLFRDCSAWYHIIFAVDTTQATASDRIKVYSNGVQITDFTTETYPALNSESYFNATNPHYIGRGVGTPDTYDGYLSEVNFIDGLALTPDSFGETGDYGEWKPLKYTGAYGTNGFYLDFKDSGDLGNDVSVNANDWTPTNLAATDQMVDSPTNNFATWNPLAIGANCSLAEGNLKATPPTTQNQGICATLGVSTGKWYWEVMVDSSATPSHIIGIANTKFRYDTVVVGSANTDSWGYYQAASKWHNGNQGSYGVVISNGDIVGVLLDLDSNTLAFNVNNSSQGTAFSSLPVDTYVPACGDLASTDLHYSYLNCGQDSSFAGNKTPQGNADGNGIGDFYYAPPTGFLALCTQNLPDATVIPSEHFNTVLWTGTGVAQSITTGFDTDLVWTKARNQTYDHNLFDSVRGALIKLSSNSTAAESSMTNSVTSFDTDGFTLGDTAQVNLNGATFVAWNWKAGGTAVSNTNGSITSSVSANPSAGFSIVSWTGTGAVLTAGHGLSQKPELIITKDRDGTAQWIVYNVDIGATGRLILSATNADDITNAIFFNNTEPTSTVFTNGTYNNTNGGRNISYCFHSVDGYSKVGSYTGNGSTDGTFVNCGFKPAWVMVKRTDAAQDWMMFDNTRNPENATNLYLQPNTSSAEASGIGDGVDFVSNGVKVRSTNPTVNGSGATYIFLAFAESPFKHSNAR